MNSVWIICTVDALKVAQNPTMVDENEASLTDQSNEQGIVEESQSTEETSNEVTMAPKTAIAFTTSDEPHNSSIVCPSRTFLLFFILSTSFVMIMSLWMTW